MAVPQINDAINMVTSGASWSRTTTTGIFPRHLAGQEGANVPKSTAPRRTGTVSSFGVGVTNPTSSKPNIPNYWVIRSSNCVLHHPWKITSHTKFHVNEWFRPWGGRNQLNPSKLLGCRQLVLPFKHTVLKKHTTSDTWNFTNTYTISGGHSIIYRSSQIHIASISFTTHSTGLRRQTATQEDWSIHLTETIIPS